MDERELYQQKQKAQLDEWKAQLDKLKAKAAGASADAKLKLNEQIKMLESKVQDAEAKLSELAKAGDDAWDSIKAGVDAAWNSLRSAFSDAAAQFKD